MTLPVDRTLSLPMNDRQFTIIDTEFFLDLCRRARLTVEGYGT